MIVLAVLLGWTILATLSWAVVRGGTAKPTPRRKP